MRVLAINYFLNDITSGHTVPVRVTSMDVTHDSGHLDIRLSGNQVQFTRVVLPCCTWPGPNAIHTSP